MPTSFAIERRQSPRTRIKGHGVAMALRDQILSYHVEDISQEGIGFVYVGWQKNWTGSVSRLDFLDRLLFLQDVEVQVVSDIPLHGEDDKVAGPPLRRVGLRFLHLDEDQRLELGNYIDTLADTEASAQSDREAFRGRSPWSSQPHYAER